MMPFRPHRFPPLSQVARRSLDESSDVPARLQTTLAEGFQEGMQKGYEQGYQEGYESGMQSGRKDGLAQGRRDGVQEARGELLAHFEEVTRPVDALIAGLRQVQSDYQSALRKEVVELVAKVARQVIRCELALQPVQLLALVDETLAAMPVTRDEIQVYLNPEELQRIRELDPGRAAQWSLLADPGLEPGECRVRAGDNEADAGCRQRLAACVERISEQLTESSNDAELVG